MAKDKKTDRKSGGSERAPADVSYGGVGAQGAAVSDVNAEAKDGAAPVADDGQKADGAGQGTESKQGSDADVTAPGIILATVLPVEAKLAVIKAAAEIKPGGEYDNRRDYVISGISRHYKVTKESVAAELDAALAANIEKAKGDDTVVLTVPRRFLLRLADGKEKLFAPGTVRVSRHIAEHPYVKANGCKIV